MQYIGIGEDVQISWLRALGSFKQNHIIYALQSRYLAYQIWKESAQQFLRYVVSKVPQISSYFSSLQHSLIRLKTTFPTLNSGTVNYAI